MDLAFVEEMYAGLAEPHLPVGGMYQADDGSFSVPFLCESYRFLGSFVHASPDTVDGRTLASHVAREVDHQVSPSAHFFKFFALDRLLGEGDDFAALAADVVTRFSIRRKMPDMLAKVVSFFLENNPHVNEIYFHPAGDDAKRVHLLNLWYARVADSIAVQRLGLEKIHLVNGDYWYGYRKA